MSINQLISAAAAEPGAAIDALHRSLMEDCFQSSFRDVRLHFSPASQAANDALGSLAFAIDGHIFFRPGFDASPGTSFTYLLAHELTHVMQKRRGRESDRNLQSMASEVRLEQEAGAIAAGVLNGIRAPQVTPDPSSSARLYGPAGHYYTSFWASLAAGFDPAMAQRIAFYTQMPDQVKELDAVAAGISMADSTLTLATIAAAHPDDYPSPSQSAADSAANQQAYQNISMQAIVQE